MKKHFYIFFAASISFFYACESKISDFSGDLVMQKKSDEVNMVDSDKSLLTEDVIDKTFEKTIHWAWKKIEPWWKKRYLRYSVYGLVAFKFFVPTMINLYSVMRGWTSENKGASSPSSLGKNIMDGVGQSLKSEEFKKLAEQYGYFGGQAFVNGAVDQIKVKIKGLFQSINNKLSAEKSPTSDSDYFMIMLGN